jgi:hypothetical protein
MEAAPNADMPTASRMVSGRVSAWAAGDNQASASTTARRRVRDLTDMATYQRLMSWSATVRPRMLDEAASKP